MNEDPPVLFSICTLYRNSPRYHQLVDELKLCGFDQGVEYLSIDNHSNEWDCYQAIRHFISSARGEYVVICHDDIRPNGNTIDALKEELEKILRKDPKAAVFGVAGKGRSLISGVGHFISPRGREYWGFANAGRACTLDECFLIVRKESNVTVSPDLKGYHFYGADLCLNANRVGFSCYALDYPVFHASDGVLNGDFFLARHDFENHLKAVGDLRVIHTTCTTLYAGEGKLRRFYSLFGSHLLIQGSLGNQDEETKDAIRKNFGRIFEYRVIWIVFEALMACYQFFLVCRALLMEAKYILVWKILHPLTWPIRRVVGDIIWWKKNWKSRWSVYFDEHE